MNVNFGLFSPLPGRIPKKLRGAAYAERALKALEEWMRGRGCDVDISGNEVGVIDQKVLQTSLL